MDFTIRMGWYSAIAHELLARLRPASQGILSKFDRLLEAPEIGQATLAAFICERHSTGISTDRIVGHLSRTNCLGLTDQRTIREGLVIPICAMFRSRGLPVERFWDAGGFLTDFLHYYLYLRARTEVRPFAQLRAELSTLWLVRNPQLQTKLLASPAAIDPTHIDIGLSETPANDEVGRLIESLQDEPDFQVLVSDRLMRHPTAIRERPDLLRVARFLHVTDLLLQRGRQIGLSQEGANQIVQARQRLAAILDGFSPWETHLLVTEDPDERFLEQCLGREAGIIVVDRKGPNAVTDRVSSRVRVPDWVVDFIFSRGARVFHESKGPIPFHVIALEQWWGRPPRAIGIGDINVSGSEIELPFVLVDDKGEQIFVPYYYDLDSVTFLYDIALLITVGHFRVDIFLMKKPQGLRLLTSGVVPVPDDLRSQLRELVLPKLRDVTGGDPKTMLTLRARNKMHSDEAAFLACEHAKSEQLLSELTAFDLQQMSTGATELVKEWEGKRQELLTWRIERAMATCTGGTNSDGQQPEVGGQLDRQMLRATERLRAVTKLIPRSESGPERLARLVTALGERSRALLHLTFREGGLTGFWARNVDGRPECGHIQFPSFDLRRGWALAHSFAHASTATRQQALREVLAFLGPSLARPITEELAIRGIEHLIISPCGFLELLPLHCAPVHINGGKDLLIDHFQQVTYAPSVTILERLQALGRVVLSTSSTSLGAAFQSGTSDIPNVLREIELVRQEFPFSKLLSGKEASPKSVLESARTASLLHFATHGAHNMSDYHSSGLQLYGSPDRDGWLSVAQILRDADLRSTGLVTLAACQTGRSYAPIEAVQEYSAIDGAFLAKGARATISSLWEIHDVASFLFMAAFYDALAGGKPVAEATKNAVKFLRDGNYHSPDLPASLEQLLSAAFPDWRTEIAQPDRDFSNVFYWGAFKCSGWTWSE